MNFVRKKASEQKKADHASIGQLGYNGSNLFSPENSLLFCNGLGVANRSFVGVANLVIH